MVKDYEDINDRLEKLFMVFTINNQKYALSCKYIIEIIEMTSITKVPFLPNYMKGIINLRSNIIPVMDIRSRFKIEEKEYNERTCIIIVENRYEKIGLIVDTVNEVLNIEKEQNMNIDISDYKENFVKGVSNINNDIKLILDCNSLMDIDNV